MKNAKKVNAAGGVNSYSFFFRAEYFAKNIADTNPYITNIFVVMVRKLLTNNGLQMFNAQKITPTR